MRRTTREIAVGSVVVGGRRPIAVQSMTNVPTGDPPRVVAQLRALESAGCEIARLAFNTQAECRLIPELRAATSMPLVADIQFDYRLAIAAMENGVDKVRFNPGNIGDDSRVKAVLDCARAHGVPIRIGVNSGSLPQYLRESGLAPEERLVRAAMRHVRLCEDHGFDRLVLSVKSSSPAVTVAAYRRLAKSCDYPLHLGVTEAGSYRHALVKSAVALGALLLDGIGDTIRVSVTGDPVAEIGAARAILRAAGLERDYCEIVSCPTCSRTGIDLFALVEATERRYGQLRRPLKLAIMGCAVNGPGEARDADFGIAGGAGRGIVFRKGKIVANVAEAELLPTFFRIVDEYIEAKDDTVDGRNK